MICDVCFVDFGGIIDRHYLKFLFKSRDRHLICISMPTGFFIWGYIQIFGGAMCNPLTLHLGVQRKLTAFSPRKVVHHAVFL